MKYRIVATNSDVYPYKIQRKDEKSFFSFWRQIKKFVYYREAVQFVRSAVERHSMYPKGTIVFEFDESDLIVDKLKNQKSENVGTLMEGPQAVAQGSLNAASILGRIKEKKYE